MNNNGNSRFLDGFMLGIIVGALGVFLFGTKSGKNLMKILSEEGLEGISRLMQEHGLADLGQEFERERDFENEPEPEPVKQHANNNYKPQEEVKEEINNVKEDIQEEVEKTPKKRFFKRLRN